MRRVSYQQPLAGLRQSQINPLRSFSATTMPAMQRLPAGAHMRASRCMEKGA
jgi:hypothetical protein